MDSKDIDYMELISLVPTVLGLVQTVVQVSGASDTAVRIIGVVKDTLNTVDIPKAIDDMKALRDAVEVMVSESREPTDDEWAALDARLDTAISEMDKVNLDEQSTT